MATRIQYVGDKDVPLPLPQGEHAGESVYRDEVNVDYQNGRWSLTGLSAEFALYSAAALAYSRVPFDPVALYWTERNLPKCDAPYWVDVGRVIFGGLEPPVNQVLFACPKSYAPNLFGFLDRFSVSSGGVLVHSLHQRVQLVDWVMLSKMSIVPADPPTVMIDVFGLSTAEADYIWHPPKNIWKDVHTLQMCPKGPTKPRTRKRNIRT